MIGNHRGLRGCAWVVCDGVESVANEDKEFIKNQYSIYDHDLTFCGGTGDLFKSVVGHETNDWNRTKRGIGWLIKGDIVL